MYTLTHMEEFETSVIPIGDGVTVSVRRQKGAEPVRPEALK